MDQEWQLHDFKLKSPHHEEKSTGFQTVLQIDPTQKEKEANGEHLRLFWARTLTCIVAPIFVTGYYAAVWARWLNRFDDQGPVAQGPANGRWVYYVWFVTSAVGIGISKYGLAGVEAAMLMDKWWAPSATTHLMAHRNKVSQSSGARIVITDLIEDLEWTQRLGIDSQSSPSYVAFAGLHQLSALPRPPVVWFHTRAERGICYW